MSYQTPLPGSAATATAPKVPKAVYRVLVTKATHEPSKKSGAPMTKLAVQILSPEAIQNANGTVSQTAGIGGDIYVAFSDKNEANCVKTVIALGGKLAPNYESREELVSACQQHLDGLVNQTFEMVVSSKKEVQTDPTGAPLTDSTGAPIQGFEVADFNMFGIVGLVKSMEELGA